jgi:hypothetical protein
MITDAYNTLTYTVTNPLAPAGVQYSSDAIDLRLSSAATTAGDLAEGQPLFVTLVVTTTFAGSAGGTANIEVGFATDAAGSSFSSVYSTGATVYTAIPAAVTSPSNAQTSVLTSFALQPLRTGNFNPYLLVKCTGGTANITAGAVKCYITMEPYDGRQLGLLAGGFTVL